MKPRNYILIASLIVTALFGYWIKNQIGIDLLDSASLSGTFPFDHLQRNDVIANPEPGILFQDSFDSLHIVRHWGELWMREEGKVTWEFDAKGRNNSRCLLVKSTSEKSWSLGYGTFIEVKKGDVFGFSGCVRQDGDTPTAYLRVAAFDKKKEAITWNYMTEKTVERGTWQCLQKKFTILEDIPYLKFALVGTGKGETRFDDIVFQKY